MITKNMFPEKIISGGQTGADQAGLRVAQQLGLETGGFAPRRFVTSDGPSPVLGSVYNLTELVCPPTTRLAVQYALRSQQNVDAADATVVFRRKASPGSDRTISYALTRQWKSLDSYPLSAMLFTNEETAHEPVCVVTDMTAHSEEMLTIFLWSTQPHQSRDREVPLRSSEETTRED